MHKMESLHRPQSLAEQAAEPWRRSVSDPHPISHRSPSGQGGVRETEFSGADLPTGTSAP